MKLIPLVVVLGAALSGAAALAQTDSAPASVQPGPATGSSDFEAHKRECRQQARQIDDPQERRRTVRECRRQFMGGAATNPAPTTPTPSSAPAPNPFPSENPLATDPAATMPVATPEIQPDQADEVVTTLPDDAAAERREQRQLQREQRRLARRQAAWAGNFDSGTVSGARGSAPYGNHPPDGPVQSGGWEDGGDYGSEWMEPSENPGLLVEEPGGPSAFAGQGGSAELPPAGYSGGNAGPANRNRRIERLERRLAEMEGLLQQILANQQQLLNR